MAVKCPKCQFDNPDDTSYCGKCATALPIPGEAIGSLARIMDGAGVREAQALGADGQVIGWYRSVG